jgi:hypothetical protein
MARPLTLDERMRVAYRIFRAMCALFRDRLITLLDPHGRIVARSDWPDSPFTLSDPHVTACPACAAQVILHRSRTPRIDACGFESYDFGCQECGAPLAGIIDPYDDAALLSVARGSFA